MPLLEHLFISQIVNLDNPLPIACEYILLIHVHVEQLTLRSESEITNELVDFLCWKSFLRLINSKWSHFFFREQFHNKQDPIVQGWTSNQRDDVIFFSKFNHLNHLIHLNPQILQCRLFRNEILCTKIIDYWKKLNGKIFWIFYGDLQVSHKSLGRCKSRLSVAKRVSKWMWC